jgi:Fe2+ or Zn2+ uptake regulation protein
MPKDIKEFEKLQPAEARQGGKKVDWHKIAEKIQESGQAYTVKEIHEGSEMANKQVTAFRVKNALDGLVEEGKLRRLWDGKRFYYGPVEPKGVAPTEPNHAEAPLTA